MSMSATIAFISALIVQAAWPFAVVSDVAVAGIFSLANTLLNAVTIFLVNRATNIAASNNAKVDQVSDKVSKVENIVDRRKMDSDTHTGQRCGDDTRYED